MKHTLCTNAPKAPFFAHGAAAQSHPQNATMRHHYAALHRPTALVLALCLFVLVAALALASCATDDDDADDVPSYALSSLYGYTYSANFTSSSGTQLTPELVVYDESHLEWNMSTSGMESTSFYYRAEQTAKNVYALYWYDSAAAYADGITSASAMSVTLGINSETSLSLMVNAGTAGAGSAMAGKPIDMTRTNAAKKTYTPPDEKENTDETKKTSEVTEIYGTWYGSTHASSSYFQTGFDGTNEACVISANADGTAKVNFTGTAFPCVWTFNVIAVTESNGSYTLSGTGTANMSMGDSEAKDYEANFTGTVTDGKLNATFAVPDVMGGTTVTFASN